jgi:secretion/DNA translocation related TadE-like protein
VSGRLSGRLGGRASRDQRGAATVLVMAMAGVLLLLGAGLGVVAALVVAHRTAQSAADLAALAGATAAGRGGDACGAAAEVAVANSSRLTGCATDGRVVEVSVSAAGPRWLGQAADLTARARAGPAP